jgi:PAS domain S-box-containing protein
MAGLTTEEALGDGWVDGLHLADRQFVKAAWDKVVDSRDRWEREYRFQDREGNITWVYGLAVPQFDDQGEIVGYVGVNLDITERREADIALRESEERFRKSFDTEVVAMAISRRRDGMYLEANPGFLKVTGYDYSEIVGHTSQELGFFSPSQRQTLITNLDEKGRLHNQELTFPTKGGELRTILFSIGPITIDSEDCMLATMVDITERKRAEAAILEERERLGNILAALETGLSLINPDMTIAWVNRKIHEMFPDEKPVGQVCHRFYEGRETPCEGCKTPCEGCGIQIAFQTGEVQIRERWNAITERWYAIIAQPIRDEQGNVVNVLEGITDITERKRMEEELRCSNEELEQFAYVVSHDLQAPLRMVKSWLELLEKRYRDELDEKASEYINHAVDGTERMEEMIQALLDLSRVETRGDKFAPTDCEAVLNDVLNDLRMSIGEAEAEVTHDPLPTVMADKAQLAQVFQNLIANTIKFRREGVPPRVHVSAEQEGDEWVFSVEDNGIGIDPEQADRIFQIFQRLHTDEEYPGLGIGLALCKRIAERHGGRIWVESEVGEGSTFSFTIPTSKEGV